MITGKTGVIFEKFDDHNIPINTKSHTYVLFLIFWTNLSQKLQQRHLSVTIS